MLYLQEIITLYWDPDTEQFKDDDEANSMLSRAQREEYALNY